MRIAVVEPLLETNGNVIRDVIYGCWCGGKRIGGATVPPFEQLTIATILKNAGHEVTFVDAQAEQLPYEAVVKRLEGTELLIMSTSVMTARGDTLFVRNLKERIPGLLVAAYGSHPTFKPEETLEKGVDFAIQREPEWVLRDLTASLDRGDRKAASEVLGVTSYGYKGEIIKNKRYPFIDDLDQIPPLDVSFLPDGVVYFNPIVRNLPYITVSTSHGCPAKCSYCTAPFFHGTKTRFMSAAKVLSDIEYYLDNGMREIYFRDETFTADRQRVIDICDGIVARGLRFTWICNARVDTVDMRVLQKMKQAGCHLIKFGAESGNQDVLDNVKKGITLEQTRDAFRWCRDVGINTHAHFMVGMPGDTLETMEDTIELACDIEPSTATFGICTPYPGTPLFRDVARADASIGDGTDNAAMERLHLEGDYNASYCDVDSTTLSRTVKQFYRRFYLRPKHLMGALARLRNGNMVRNAVIGGTNVIGFIFNRQST
ncbi:MAG: B12-binding domain-containing radical SAM protein [Rhodospirillales bacterium]